MYYASREGSIEAMRLLFEFKCEINHIVSCFFFHFLKDTYKQTPLFYSARYGKFEACKFLIENGINIHHKVYFLLNYNIKTTRTLKNKLHCNEPKNTTNNKSTIYSKKKEVKKSNNKADLNTLKQLMISKIKHDLVVF